MPPVQWYRPADDPKDVHYGYAGPRWIPLVPLVLQMPLFLVLFRAFRSGDFGLLALIAVLTAAATFTAWLLSRRAGVGYYVVDALGRPVRRASRKSDRVPRILRNRPTVSRAEFLERASGGGE